MGLNWELQVKAGVLTVIEDGVVRTRQLDALQAARLNSLATRVANEIDSIVPYNGTLPSDSMETSIEFLDGVRRTTLRVRSGDATPDEVWELLKTASEAAAG